ncbi:glycosyltransferase WbuB [Echinicola strongylocentroti]|uniref:Glycosyltransferase WbuB n=1 Tax=Echinicola strongylocentroti TaxID=1795355 RepID=A0A2Z4IK05_9BACT|nr:glycosyltransferase family 4 protein [Echinicola strongylocentroti]AWW30876.1 glycosyltransferase WbuB [Echinicola strongylocentroti]
MRIIYIHQYFVTPEEGGAVRSYHLAKGLVEAGIDVEMITTHNENHYQLKEIDGIKVHYLPVQYDHSFGFYRRVWAFYQFVRHAKRLIKRLQHPDLLYITSTPLTTGLIGLWAKRKLGLPYVFEVRDLWPEAPIQVGMIQHTWLKKILYQLERNIYHQASQIVGLSQGICDYIHAVAPEKKVHLIPNFSDVGFFTPSAEKDPAFLRKMGWSPDHLTIAYTGAVGDVNAVDELVKLADLAQREGKNWQFAIMGKGKQLDTIKAESNRLELKNLQFLPFGSKEQVRKLLSHTDLSFISFDDLPVLETNSPNKFFDAIAMGNAILINHEGWVWHLVKGHGLGIFFDHKKPLNTLQELEKWEQNPELLASMKLRSRQLATSRYSVPIAVEKLLKVIGGD